MIGKSFTTKKIKKEKDFNTEIDKLLMIIDELMKKFIGKTISINFSFHFYCNVDLKKSLKECVDNLTTYINHQLLTLNPFLKPSPRRI